MGEEGGGHYIGCAFQIDCLNYEFDDDPRIHGGSKDWSNEFKETLSECKEALRQRKESFSECKGVLSGRKEPFIERKEGFFEFKQPLIE